MSQDSSSCFNQYTMTSPEFLVAEYIYKIMLRIIDIIYIYADMLEENLSDDELNRKKNILTSRNTLTFIINKILQIEGNYTTPYDIALILPEDDINIIISPIIMPNNEFSSLTTEQLTSIQQLLLNDKNIIQVLSEDLSNLLESKDKNLNFKNYQFYQIFYKLKNDIVNNQIKNILTRHQNIFTENLLISIGSGAKLDHAIPHFARYRGDITNQDYQRGINENNKNIWNVIIIEPCSEKLCPNNCFCRHIVSNDSKIIHFKMIVENYQDLIKTSLRDIIFRILNNEKKVAYVNAITQNDQGKAASLTESINITKEYSEYNGNNKFFYFYPMNDLLIYTNKTGQINYFPPRDKGINKSAIDDLYIHDLDNNLQKLLPYRINQNQQNTTQEGGSYKKCYLKYQNKLKNLN
jgi:hypothetical protein